MSPFEWWDEALEFGVVDTVEFGEPGLISFGVVLPTDFPSDLIGESDVVFVTFCCANRSCFLNLARIFNPDRNQTKLENVRNSNEW